MRTCRPGPLLWSIHLLLFLLLWLPPALFSLYFLLIQRSAPLEDLAIEMAGLLLFGGLCLFSLRLMLQLPHRYIQYDSQIVTFSISRGDLRTVRWEDVGQIVTQIQEIQWGYAFVFFDRRRLPVNRMMRGYQDLQLAFAQRGLLPVPKRIFSPESADAATSFFREPRRRNPPGRADLFSPCPVCQGYGVQRKQRGPLRSQTACPRCGGTGYILKGSPYDSRT